ncbi:4Fe-4S single cluster domain-containing protein [Brevibacillus parabrevis]|uniref:4Fe-4S single cluster domain-containing protein n=1 Tax=Brevibacillus parabrevis TaxID=54914 RepID=UPI0023804476|nr:4Fe-4S single cluster domain-containing protein [Brevibacillus parabrevis]WDV97971.1 4Fe-4S single cluster domain-containing protein [Brevibacillus parabrevis]
MLAQSLRVHEICKQSRVNGPGNRAVVWVQGCSIGCRGCFNPNTHPDKQDGRLYEPDSLGQELGRLPVDGLTVSGGEPLDQPEQVRRLVQSFRQVHSGTVLLFTGYTAEAILRCEEKRKALLLFDVAIAGPYQAQSEEIWHGKKLIVLTNRITPEELIPQRKVELVQGESSLHLTGFPTANIQSSLYTWL